MRLRNVSEINIISRAARAAGKCASPAFADPIQMDTRPCRICLFPSFHRNGNERSANSEAIETSAGGSRVFNWNKVPYAVAFLISLIKTLRHD